MHIIKLLTNALSLMIKTNGDSWKVGLDFDISHLNNRRNENMNNLMSIDFANRDHLDDTDYLLSRFCQEYPRWSHKYKSRHKKYRQY